MDLVQRQTIFQSAFQNYSSLLKIVFSWILAQQQLITWDTLLGIIMGFQLYSVEYWGGKSSFDADLEQNIWVDSGS